MKYVLINRAETDSLEILEVNEFESIYKELSRLLNVPLVEIVKTQKLKDMTEDEDTDTFMCMVIDDNGLNSDNPIENILGSYLYGGKIVGDAIFCKFRNEVFQHVVEAFDSEEEALEWANKLK